MENKTKETEETKIQEAENGTTAVDTPDYRSERARLASFTMWPLNKPDPRMLAAAGFYCTGREDEVKCFQCNVGLWEWCRDHDPSTCHGIARPTCPFFLKLPCGNIPLNGNPDGLTTTTPGNAPAPETAPANEAPPDPPRNQWMQAPTKLRPVNLSLREGKAGPLRPAFGPYLARLGSFAGWPRHMRPRKETLAEAGFYYTGWSDQVGCFTCGGQIKHWEPLDDPWVKHSQHFPRCAYVTTVKGPPTFSGNAPALVVNPMAPSTSQFTGIARIEPVPSNSLVVPLATSNKTAETRNPHTSELEALLKTLAKDHRGSSIRIGGEIVVSVRDWKECRYCPKGAVEYVNLPCFHANMCSACSCGTTQCKECRTPLRTLVKVTYSQRI